MSVGKQAGKGFISFLLRGVLEKVMGLIAMIFLARRLSPYDFGLVSITEVLLTLISVIGTTGLAEFLLAYRKDDIDEIFRAAFWFNIIITAGILVLFLALIPVWAYYQHDDRILKIGWLVGGVFVFSQLQIIPKTWLSKNLMFDKQVKLQAPFIIIVPIAKIIAVFAGMGVYSLIVPTLLVQPVLTLLLYIKTNIRPTLHLYINRWKEIYHFTKHLIGATIFSRITDQGDKFILAKFLGLDKLGIYNLAFQLAELFTSQIVQVSNNVLSSVLPKYVDDKERFYNYYISFLKTFSFLTFPLLAVMFIAAKPIVLFLYGAKWIEAVLPLKILVVVAAFKAVTSSYGSVMNSFHLNKKSFIVTAVYGPFHITASIIGSFFGVAGIATAVATVKIIFMNWNIKQIMHAMTKPFGDWYKQLSPYFIGNFLIGILLSVAFYLFPLNIKPVFSIAITGTAFVALYIMLFRSLYRKELVTISSLIDMLFPKASRYFNFLFKA